MKSKKTYIAEFIKGGRVVQRHYSAKPARARTYEEIEPLTGAVVATYYKAKGNNPYVVRYYAKTMAEEYIEHKSRIRTIFRVLAQRLRSRGK